MARHLRYEPTQPLKSKLKPKSRKNLIVQARIGIDTRFLGSNIDMVTGEEMEFLKRHYSEH